MFRKRRLRTAGFVHLLQAHVHTTNFVEGIMACEACCLCIMYCYVGLASKVELRMCYETHAVVRS
jgi:hypothetical protein